MSKGIGGETRPESKGIGGETRPESKGIGGSVESGSYSSGGGSSSSGGNCFVATAAYGTPWQPEIQVLRNFRDEKLSYSAAGRKFIKFYYEAGPRAASFINQNPGFKKPVRLIIRAIIHLIK